MSRDDVWHSLAKLGRPYRIALVVAIAVHVGYLVIVHVPILAWLLATVAIIGIGLWAGGMRTRLVSILGRYIASPR